MSLFHKLTKKRLYSTTKKHMDSVTISVKQERFVKAEGVDDIPHRIVTAMTTSREWLDHAIKTLESAEYQKDDRLAKVYLQVYRRWIAPPQLRPGQHQRDAEQEKDFENRLKKALVSVQEKLRKIRVGLGQDQIIKVNDTVIEKNGRPELDENGQKKHYLGLVKGLTGSGGTEWGSITIGYTTFREKHNLVRALIHEAAHKYDSAKDGPDNQGYWKRDFSDYLKPDIGFDTTINNADSHALFVWALNVERTGVRISEAFETSLENRWIQRADYAGAGGAKPLPVFRNPR